MFLDRTGHSWSSFWNQFKAGWNSIDWDKVGKIAGTIGMVAFSILEIAGGIALCFVPALLPVGLGLIGVGMGSLISADMNAANGGSYWAGWAGGQIGGLASMIPIPFLGGYLGSVVSDWIDKGWNNIDFEKAKMTGLVSGLFHIAPTVMGLAGGNALIPNLVGTVKVFFTDIVVGWFNSQYNKGNKKEGGAKYIGSRKYYSIQ